MSILGDTICTEDDTKSEASMALTLQNLIEIITLHLNENNIAINTDLQNTIHTEINIAMENLKENTNEQSKQNIQSKAEMNKLRIK